MFMRRVSQAVFRFVPALLILAAASGQALADPPGRVARLSYVGGEVSMRPAGIDEWTEARINRPLIAGDNLYTDRASRVELEIGAATVRLDERSAFGVLNLDDETAQIELTAGTMNLTVRRVFEGQVYEIDTPTLALVIDEPGQFRIDIAPDGSSTMISVVDGRADIYGSDNASFRVRDGLSYRFYDSRLEDYESFDLPRQDDFDRWCYERYERYERSPSRRYVSEDVIGYADLDDYGSWRTTSDYGAVWYPTRVAVDWAPYRDGHWSWIDPWGWTWVDNAPWGFAPSHYGRWVYVSNRWGWIPCPRNVRPVYAPALVAFVGGGGFSVTVSTGGPVGWFPLGPRDVYVPWYSGSRDYFNRVNIRNTTVINNVYITNVYNDYSRGRPINNFDYAYRRNDRAFTAVSHDDFINARAVNRSRVRVAEAQLARSQVVSRVQMTPTARSFVGGSAERGGGRAVRAETFDRRVIARTAPQVQRVDAQTRIQAISRNNNQPLAISEMRELSARKPQNDRQRDRRVQVVGNADRGASPTPRALPERASTEGRGRAERSDRGVAARPAEGRDNARKPSSDRAEPTTKPAMRNDRMGRDEAADRPVIERKPRGEPRAAPIEREQSVERGRPQRAEADKERERAARDTGRRERSESIQPAPRTFGDDASERKPQRYERAEQARPQAREVEQRQPQRRVEPARDAPERKPMQRDMQRNVQEPRQVQQRSAPQPQPYPQQRNVPEQRQPQNREMQRMPPQQRVEQPRPQRAPPNAEQQRGRDQSNKKDDTDEDKGERKRRDRN